MGIDYTSGMFFGTFARPGSRAEAVLRSLQNDKTGEFDFNKVPGVIVDRHGNSWSGEFAYAIKLRGGSAGTSRTGGHWGPIAACASDEKSIKEAMASLECDDADFEPIGVYLYQDVW